MKKTSLKSPYLKKGDIIDIVAPASAPSVEEIDFAVNWLKQQGYEARIPHDLLDPQLYLANTDKKRFEHLKKALTNSSSKAVWCLRGGYGSIRLVSELLKLKKSTEKFFIGLSDITVIHHFLNQKWNWKTIHGPIFARALQAQRRPEDYDDLFGLLTGTKDFIEFNNLTPLNKAADQFQKAKNKKVISGKVKGGNLCTYCSLLGTKLHPKDKNHFLFFEDISERGYKIDRMLNQLSLAGVFDHCRGVFFGNIINAEEADGTNLVWPTIEKFFEKYKFPVFRGVDSDHSGHQRPLYLNTKAELINNEGSFLKVYSR